MEDALQAKMILCISLFSDMFLLHELQQLSSSQFTQIKKQKKQTQENRHTVHPCLAGRIVYMQMFIM